MDNDIIRPRHAVSIDESRRNFYEDKARQQAKVHVAKLKALKAKKKK
jgi:hypothetical protein